MKITQKSKTAQKLIKHTQFKLQNNIFIEKYEYSSNGQ